MVRSEAVDPVDKVDVVIPGVGKGGRVEDRCHLGDRRLEDIRSDERVETEHPDAAQLVAIARDQCLTPRTVELQQGPTVEVKDVSHESSGGSARPDTGLQIQLSSSG